MWRSHARGRLDMQATACWKDCRLGSKSNKTDEFYGFVGSRPNLRFLAIFLKKCGFSLAGKYRIRESDLRGTTLATGNYACYIG